MRALLGHESVGLGGRQAAGPVGLVGGQERVGQHVVDPGGHGRVPGAVGAVALGTTVDGAVGVTDGSDGGLDLGDRAVGRLGDVHRRARQAPERVVR